MANKAKVEEWVAGETTLTLSELIEELRLDGRSYAYIADHIKLQTGEAPSVQTVINWHNVGFDS